MVYNLTPRLNNNFVLIFSLLSLVHWQHFAFLVVKCRNLRLSKNMFEEYLLNNHKEELIRIIEDVEIIKHFSINIKYVCNYVYFIYLH